MLKGIFIAGTDTGVGKTVITSAILKALQTQGKTVIGMKPVASGCEVTADGLRNDDALSLIRYSNVTTSYSMVNPYAFEEAIAPHIAAKLAGVCIHPERITALYKRLSSQADHVIVEGVGGWLVPISATQTMADLAVMLDLPVVLVVGMRLGCINHALLSYQSILTSGLPCAGWVANQIEAGMPRLAENIDTLTERIHAPLLGQVSYNPQCDIESVQAEIDISLIAAD